jgi:hypothetical protein
MSRKEFVEEASEPMSVTIDLPAELEQNLREYAARGGQEVNAIVLQALREKIARTRSFAEVCAPFALAVGAAGMTDAEFDRFFEEVREETWQEKQGKSQ